MENNNIEETKPDSVSYYIYEGAMAMAKLMLTK